MTITPQQRTSALLGVCVLVLVVGFGWNYWKAQRPTKTRPSATSVSRKPTSKTTPPAQAPARDISEPVAQQQPNTASDTKQVAEEFVRRFIPDLTNQLPADQTLSEPDPREKGGYRGDIFVRLDLNGDLRLEGSEIPTHYREPMMACDRDEDGLINFDEFLASLPLLPASPEGRTTVAASALVNPPEPGREIPTYFPKDSLTAKRQAAAPLWFTNLDRSRDGHIAVYEWPAGRLNEFRALDNNNDGFITLEEAQKAEAIKESATQSTTTNADELPGKGRDSAQR